MSAGRTGGGSDTPGRADLDRDDLDHDALDQDALDRDALDQDALDQDAPALVERHLEVARTARYAELGHDLERPDEVWFALHGYRQLARRFLRRFTPLADGSRRIVAPEGLSRFYVEREVGRHGPESVVGATWMTREDRDSEIVDYVRYLDLLTDRVLSGLPETRVCVLGFSQGVATAARWVVRGSMRPALLITWGDTIPPDLDMDAAARALKGVRLVRVRGDRDRAVSEARHDEETGRLDRAGIAHETVRFPGGHDLDADTLLRVARG